MNMFSCSIMLVQRQLASQDHVGALPFIIVKQGLFTTPFLEVVEFERFL